MNNENQTIHKSDDNLTIYGWNEKLNQLKQESIYSTLAHGRVSIVHRTCYEVISGNADVSPILSVPETDCFSVNSREI